jgi:hypothetical protein
MFDQKPNISLQSELAEVARAEGSSHKDVMQGLKDQLRVFRDNPNIDPAEALADKWKRDKCGKEWHRDRVANLVSWAMKIRKEMTALNDEAAELFFNVLRNGPPDWFKDWQ